MNTAGGSGRARIKPESLEAALQDLASVRRLLVSAGRGEAGGEEVKASVKEYVEVHGPALREAARAVGESVRTQLLAELYRWRAQLDAQLKGASAQEEGPAASARPQAP